MFYSESQMLIGITTVIGFLIVFAGVIKFIQTCKFGVDEFSEVVVPIVIFVVGASLIVVPNWFIPNMISREFNDNTQTYSVTSIHRENIVSGGLFHVHSVDTFIIDTDDGEYRLPVSDANVVESDEEYIEVNDNGFAYRVITVAITEDNMRTMGYAI